ncbi:MAG: hypothetical protein ABI472_22555 [Ginsengibacter sp.]
MFKIHFKTNRRRIIKNKIFYFIDIFGLAALLLKDFLKLVALSCLVAFPVAWWIMHAWLQNYEYRITTSWWIFLIAGAVAILIALFTISFQAIRTAIVSHVRSLGSE